MRGRFSLPLILFIFNPLEKHETRSILILNYGKIRS